MFVRGLYWRQKIWGRGGGSINSLEFGEYSDPRESQYDVGVSAFEHCDGERSKDIGSWEICEKG